MRLRRNCGLRGLRKELIDAHSRERQRLPIWRPGISPAIALRRTVTGWIRSMIASSATVCASCAAEVSAMLQGVVDGVIAGRRRYAFRTLVLDGFVAEDDLVLEFRILRQQLLEFAPPDYANGPFPILEQAVNFQFWPCVIRTEIPKWPPRGIAILRTTYMIRVIWI